MKRVPMTHFDQARDGVPLPQHGALCWRSRDGQTEILLVTSRETGRWVIPKGWPIEGLDGAETAAREAWEEAGAVGTVGHRPLGAFAYDKVLDRGTGPVRAVPCLVTVYPLQVATVQDRFPEAGKRRQRWFAQAKAARKVDEPGLRALIEAFAPAAG